MSRCRGVRVDIRCLAEADGRRRGLDHRPRGTRRKLAIRVDGTAFHDGQNLNYRYIK